MSKPLQDLPAWYQPEAPIGSAVRYVASLCSQAAGVEVVRPGGRAFRLGRCGGARGLARLPGLEVSLGEGASKKGTLRVYLREHCALGESERQRILEVVRELGERWPRK